ncbi:siderophore-interacting protein [Klebsiella sp. WOUb02]|uniref:siderophore-interacting protein n=1 Tax=Klebsiella sp. WOUb02 TaxID=3161071 RepID=UPI003CF33718
MDKQASRLLRPAVVHQITDIHPRMTRVVLSGETVAHFADALPGAWVKVFFTPPGEAEGPGRAYTISHLNKQAQTLSLDIVRHSDGAAMRWIKSARPGDIIRLAGPREGLAARGITSLLLFGDETAIPAICAILPTLEEHVSAHVILTPGDHFDYPLPPVSCPLKVTRLSSRTVDICQHVINVIEHLGPEKVWGAGEHSDITRIRQTLFKSGRSRKDTDITAYWKQGEADHRDS